MSATEVPTPPVGQSIREYTYAREEDARRQRREFIESGRAVSLLAFDPSRERFVFDVTG